MKIFVEDPSEYDLKGMLWSGAEKALEEIIDADKWDEFCQYIDDVYYDGIGLTELNDILRFDFDQLKKDIGMFGLEDEVNTKVLKELKKDVIGASKIEDLSDETYSLFNDLSDKLDELEDCDNEGDFEEIKDEIDDIVEEIYDNVIENNGGYEDVIENGYGDSFQKDIQKNIIDVINNNLYR